jgi:hypothetical protein
MKEGARIEKPIVVGTKKQRQFDEILARLDVISAKLDELLFRFHATKPREKSEIIGKSEPDDYLLGQL